jgi:ATP-dependent helicase HrpA
VLILQENWLFVHAINYILDERLEDLRWLFEELRVSFFAQELCTPQLVSIKRIQ